MPTSIECRTKNEIDTKPIIHYTFVPNHTNAIITLFPDNVVRACTEKIENTLNLRISSPNMYGERLFSPDVGFDHPACATYVYETHNNNVMKTVAIVAISEKQMKERIKDLETQKMPYTKVKNKKTEVRGVVIGNFGVLLRAYHMRCPAS